MLVCILFGIRWQMLPSPESGPKLVTAPDCSLLFKIVILFAPAALIAIIDFRSWEKKKSAILCWPLHPFQTMTWC